MRDDLTGFADYWQGMCDLLRMLAREGRIMPVGPASGAQHVGGAGPLAQISPAESGGEAREDSGEDEQA